MYIFSEQTLLDMYTEFHDDILYFNKHTKQSSDCYMSKCRKTTKYSDSYQQL